MKFYERFIYRASLYTVAITFAFYLTATIINIPSLQMSFGRYFLILALGVTVAAAELIFSVERFSIPIRYLLNYSALAVTFTSVFIAVRASDDKFIVRGSTAIASLLAFTVFYALAVLFSFLIKRIKKRSSAHSKGGDKEKNKREEVTYQPRFK